MVKDYQRKYKAKAPKPQGYKSDPADMERFIQQLENMWVLESHKYKKNITKIRCAANLLHCNTTDKHRYPVKWYEAYYPKSYLAAARRLPGGSKPVLDLKWSEWSIFVESSTAAFATRAGMEQAVNQCLNLKYTNSIDDFLDSLTNLIWWTGYKD